MTVRAVFDCMIFLQALATPSGPAMACLDFIDQSKSTLLLSRDILNELADVLTRPQLRRRFKRLRPEAVAEFLDQVRSRATMMESRSTPYPLHRDPDDQPYLDLAIEGDADFLVTWNSRHLTYLMDASTQEGAEFRRRFPRLIIADPVEFLKRVRP